MTRRFCDDAPVSYQTVPGLDDPRPAQAACRATPADDLRAENERLRAVLQGIASSGRCDFSAVRAALSQKGGA